MGDFDDFDLEKSNNSFDSAHSHSPIPEPSEPARTVYNCVPDTWNLDEYVLTESDKTLFINAGRLIIGYNSFVVLSVYSV